MKIIQATLEHLPGILEINKIIDYGNPEFFMIESIEAKRVSVCMSEDKQIVWYSLYQEIWGNTLLLALVKVLPDFQWNKIGTKLIHYFEEQAKARWHSKYLSSTELSNILSQKFHKKLWFEPIGELGMTHGKELFYKKEL